MGSAAKTTRENESLVLSNATKETKASSGQTRCKSSDETVIFTLPFVVPPDEYKRTGKRGYGEIFKLYRKIRKFSAEKKHFHKANRADRTCKKR